MRYHHFFKIGFWILVLATVWCCIGQCDHGRLSEAFVMVDAGLQRSHSVLENDSPLRYRYLYSLASVYPTSKNLQLVDSFKKLEQAHSDYNSFLDSLRSQLLIAAHLSDEQYFSLQNLEPNRHAVRQVLLTGQANSLMQISERTGQLRSAMLALADNESWVVASLPVDFTATPDGDYNLWRDYGDFRDLPLAGALAMLSNLQLSTDSGMKFLVSYLAQKMNSHSSDCFAFMPVAVTESSYIQSGDSYTADIFLGAYPEEVDIIKATLNGQPLRLKNYMGRYEAPATGIGRKTFLVEIIGSKVYENRAGFYRDTFRVNKEFSYEVGMGKPVIHVPSNIYYLYMGIENPISISAWDIVCGVDRFSSIGATLKNLGGGHCVLTPCSLHPVTLRANSREFQYQVRSLPDPLAVLTDRLPSNSISHEMIASQTALNARFPEDFDFQVDCQVTDFHLTRFRAREDPKEVFNQGSNFNEQVHHLLERTLPGDRLLFDDIHVKCPDKKQVRTIEALSLRVL